ncbi:MAG: heat-inducible transcriptional repressor HrcA [Alphaproteobacteria bacterium]|nr:heat-inducible transcriptional repressor HrcA [Alphaproteobacteria bacterium]
MTTTTNTKPPAQNTSPLAELDQRAREVFARIVQAYTRDGNPVGSRTLARAMNMRLSPATLRNVMADLEAAGLLNSPHPSAGRIPSEHGLQLYVNGLLERADLSQEKKDEIREEVARAGHDTDALVQRALSMLCELSACAGLVAAPALDDVVIRHMEFVSLGPGRVLLVLVTSSGHVENRVLDVPLGLPSFSLVEAGNYISRNFAGHSLRDAQNEINTAMRRDRARLDEITRRLVKRGLASWAGDETRPALVVSGHAHLLASIEDGEDIERVRHLFSALERQEAALKLLRLSERAEGVQIFIGAENELFSLAGCAMIVAPYAERAGGAPVGALGVIGPARLDYARIIPMVDYTAQVVRDLAGREPRDV